MIRLIRGHIVLRIGAWDLSLDREKVTDRLNHGLRYVAHLGSQLLHEPEEKIPRSGSDPRVLVVNEVNEVFEYRSDILVVPLEEGMVTDANLHVLEKNCWMGEVRNACQSC